jgi:hypothetical protein
VRGPHSLGKLGTPVLIILLVSVSGCQIGSSPGPTSTSGHAVSTATAWVQPEETAPAPTSTAMIASTPSPTPWLPAFSRVTLIPVVDFWWTEDGYLHYEAHDSLLWSYNPVGRKVTTSAVQRSVQEWPSAHVQSLIPEEVPDHRVYFSPSGSRALYAIMTYYYAEITQPPGVDGENPPARVTSEVWSVSETDEPDRLTLWEGSMVSVSWSASEEVALVTMGGIGPFVCPSSAWLIRFPEEQIENALLSSGDNLCQYCHLEIAPDGRKFYYQICDELGGREVACEHWVRWLEESEAYRDEQLQFSFDGYHIRWLPNSMGLLAIDGELIYLYDLERESWLQLTNTNVPYMQMDPIASSWQVHYQLSPDLHYIAWNGGRGLQVFSLCPAGGELLSCE